ncbi:pyridoxal-phosphate dependent enzyme, partial [Streptomyces sp. UG1]|uniref:pyridoxal-phosphate dependent enzyme n=1 Tax=Streptomyces sp. UG1 TaxID=3417652 RepID=UPI003CFA4514
MPKTADIAMGEDTPLVTTPGQLGVQLKVDRLMPTGPLKDRGGVMPAALAARLDVSRLMADSSGNARTAVATRAGIACDVYVPAGTSAGKVAQLRAYGATVHQIPRTREDTVQATARAADEPGVIYAGDVHYPFFPHGTKTYVLELREQLGCGVPDTLARATGGPAAPRSSRPSDRLRGFGTESDAADGWCCLGKDVPPSRGNTWWCPGVRPVGRGATAGSRGRSPGPSAWRSGWRSGRAGRRCSGGTPAAWSRRRGRAGPG